MKKYQKLFYKDVNSIEIHELAKLTPLMTEEDFNALKNSIKELGQLEPVVFWQGKLIDGRHRLKALKLLGIEKIMYTNLDPHLKYEDVRNLVIKGYEMRRHLTPTQKAIRAYNEYIRLKNNGEKISMSSVAEDFGSSRAMINRAKKLYEYAPDNIIQALLNGEKVQLGSKGKTDSLYSIINYFKTLSEEILKDSRTNEEIDITDDEKEYVNSVLADFECNFDINVLKYLAKLTYKKYLIN